MSKKVTVTFDVNGVKKSVDIDANEHEKFNQTCYRAVIMLSWRDDILRYDSRGFIKKHPECVEDVAMGADLYNQYDGLDPELCVRCAIDDVKHRLKTEG